MQTETYYPDCVAFFQKLGPKTDLPSDPRTWSREDVWQWLRVSEKQHQLPPISRDRFHMNGKALCLMNLDMFVQRVPLGGKLLYKDFQLRLSTAMYKR